MEAVVPNLMRFWGKAPFASAPTEKQSAEQEALL